MSVRRVADRVQARGVARPCRRAPRVAVSRRREVPRSAGYGGDVSALPVPSPCRGGVCPPSRSARPGASSWTSARVWRSSPSSPAATGPGASSGACPRATSSPARPSSRRPPARWPRRPASWDGCSSSSAPSTTGSRRRAPGAQVRAPLPPRGHRRRALHRERPRPRGDRRRVDAARRGAPQLTFPNERRIAQAAWNRLAGTA